MMYKPSHVSYSQISTYLTCPQQYNFKYVLGLKPASTPIAWVFGGAFHQGLNAYYQGKDYKQPMMIELYKEVKSGRMDKQTYTKYVRMGEAMMEELKVNGRAYRVKETERKITVQLQHPISNKRLQVPFTAVIDLVSLDGDVVDHKTTSGDISRFRDGYEMQLRLYSLVYRVVNKEAPNRLTIQAITKRLGKSTVYYEDIEPDDVQESVVFEEASRVIERILMNDFVATPSKWSCRMCEYRQICPASAWDE
jgi:putative RecB family exonuclease